LIPDDGIKLFCHEAKASHDQLSSAESKIRESQAIEKPSGFAKIVTCEKTPELHRAPSVYNQLCSFVQVQLVGLLCRSSAHRQIASQTKKKRKEDPDKRPPSSPDRRGLVRGVPCSRPKHRQGTNRPSFLCIDRCTHLRFPSSRNQVAVFFKPNPSPPAFKGREASTHHFSGPPLPVRADHLLAKDFMYRQRRSTKYEIPTACCPKDIHVASTSTSRLPLAAGQRPVQRKPLSSYSYPSIVRLSASHINFAIAKPTSQHSSSITRADQGQKPL